MFVKGGSRFADEHAARPSLIAHAQMTNRPHQLRDQGGFTLIELLIVVLIIGILAAISIPLLLNQREKAGDASAKAQVRNAQTAAETYATDHNGEFKGLEPSKLKEIELTLSDESTAKLLKAEAKGAGFVVQSEAVKTKNKYSIERNESGEVTRRCEKEKVGACPQGGSW
jgi:type IV pilus assembly protein PilA